MEKETVRNFKAEIRSLHEPEHPNSGEMRKI
jgi:hypothetical protein